MQKPRSSDMGITQETEKRRTEATKGEEEQVGAADVLDDHHDGKESVGLLTQR